MEKDQTVTTERRIGNVTYIVVAGPGEGAQEQLESKINNLLQRDIRQAAKSSEGS